MFQISHAYNHVCFSWAMLYFDLLPQLSRCRRTKGEHQLVFLPPLVCFKENITRILLYNDAPELEIAA